jgi:signal peptide peptidase SppA
MKILEILNSPWAIIPETQQEIREIYLTHVRGESIDLKDIETRIGKPLERKEQGYDVIDGVAVIPIEGPIAKRMNLFTQVSGGSSTELIERDFDNALVDSGVKAIVLKIDSPGGQVDGIQELSKLIYENRGKKPIAAFTNGTMASAAYWIGSAAEKIFISSDTVQIGSIGVATTHSDISRSEDMRGIKTTEIYAGKYKRIASEYRPLTAEGKAYIQDIVDYLYTTFVNDIARNRGISTEDVLKMADGKLFIGRQAIYIGLVDGVSTLPLLISKLNPRTKKDPIEDLRSEWDKDPLIRAEFREFERFRAFKQYEMKSQLKHV